MAKAKTVFCYLILILSGPVGKSLATIAVIMMGFGALFGKVSCGQAIIMVVGISVTFAAPQIVTYLLPAADTSGCVIPTGTGFGFC
jgi:type IV secretory pathway VirB2 component (pilin)